MFFFFSFLLSPVNFDSLLISFLLLPEERKQLCVLSIYLSNRLISILSATEGHLIALEKYQK